MTQMKIRVVLEIEVDPADWRAVNGCERTQVRDDVKAYIVNQVRYSAAIDEADAEVTLR